MTSPIYTIGIDPGITGAWVLLKDGKLHYFGNFPKKGKMIDFQSLNNIFIKDLEIEPKVYIEKQFTPAKNGGVKTSWRNYQSVFLAFVFNGIEPIEIPSHITPKKDNTSEKGWQQELGISLTDEEKLPFKDLPRKEKTKAQRQLIKAKALKFATSRQPELNFYNIGKKGQTLNTVNDGLVDAYCIAYAGYLIESL